MNAAATIDDRRLTRDTGGRTDPLQPRRNPVGRQAVGRRNVTRGREPLRWMQGGCEAAIGRQQEQLPMFAPLLEEVEIAGWSSCRPALRGNFHDWMLRDDGRLLAMVGQVGGRAAADPAEAALVAQSVWMALRAHAHHVNDAAEVLSLASRSIWTTPALEQQTSVAVAIVDAVGGHVSLAIAGECLVWRVRAASWQQLCDHQPPLGEAAGQTYRSQKLTLSLRERLLLVADDPLCPTKKLASSIEAGFTRIDAEQHRRITAEDALAIVRGKYEQLNEVDKGASLSAVAVRRR